VPHLAAVAQEKLAVPPICSGAVRTLPAVHPLVRTSAFGRPLQQVPKIIEASLHFSVFSNLH